MTHEHMHEYCTCAAQKELEKKIKALEVFINSQNKVIAEQEEKINKLTPTRHTTVLGQHVSGCEGCEFD